MLKDWTHKFSSLRGYLASIDSSTDFSKSASLSYHTEPDFENMANSQAKKDKENDGNRKVQDAVIGYNGTEARHQEGAEEERRSRWVQSLPGTYRPWFDLSVPNRPRPFKGQKIDNSVH